MHFVGEVPGSLPGMPRPLQHSADFTHPVPQVLAAIAGEESLRERLAEIGGTNAELLSHEKSGTGYTYTMRQGIPAEKLPGLIQKVHSGDLIVQRKQTWRELDDGTVSGTAQAEVTGVPGAITVDTTLRPHGQGTKLQVGGQVKVSIPLIGGKIESVIAEQVVKLLAREDEYIAQQLGQ